jgi:hypothetical protein
MTNTATPNYVERDNTGASKELADVLRKAFERIENKDDWKAPINAVIHREDYVLFSEAVEFFTATPLVIMKHIGNSMFHVTAKGYRAGPAGP